MQEILYLKLGINSVQVESSERSSSSLLSSAGYTDEPYRAGKWWILNVDFGKNK